MDAKHHRLLQRDVRIPAHIKAPMEGHGHAHGFFHAFRQKIHIQRSVRVQRADDHTGCTGTPAEPDLIEDLLFFLRCVAEITEPGPQ